MLRLFCFLIMAIVLPFSAFSQQFNGNKEGKMAPPRLVRGVEIEPFFRNPPGNEYFSLPELGVDLIWDNKLNMLYVLKKIYFEGRELKLNGKNQIKGMPLTVISEVFMVGEDDFKELRLGKFADSGEEFRLGVLTSRNSLQIEIYSTIPDTKPVYYRKWVVQ